jgi:glutaredoxin
MTEKFIIIGRSTCPFCVRAVDYCTAKERESIFLDYAKKEEMLEEYKQFHNHPTVPIILANNLETGYTKKVGGYTDLLEYL